MNLQFDTLNKQFMKDCGTPKIILKTIIFSEHVRGFDLVHLADSDGGDERRDGLHVRLLLRKDASHQTQPKKDLGGIHRRSCKLSLIISKIGYPTKLI